MRTYLWIAYATAAALFFACGGDVKVDGEPGSQRGQGGSGASSSTTSNSSTSTTTPSTSTGPVPSTSTGPTPACECFGACQKIIDCGFGDVPCDEFCSEIPAQYWQCVCDVSCDGIEGCFNGGTGGSGGSPQDCESCVQDAVGSTCQEATAECFNNDECVALFECHQNCGWTPECNSMCDQAFPGGIGPFLQFISCAVCGQCLDLCLQTPLINYCLDDA